MLIARRWLSALVAVSLFATIAGCRNTAVPKTAEEYAAAVTIHRDAWGVPHIFGPTDESVVFGYMYAQAEDNFWQVEDSMIQSLGRAAEVNGEAALADDLLNRALEIVPLAKAEWERTDPEIQGLCRAAVAGLNFYLASHPEVTPRLIREFEPWHLLAFSRFATYQQFIFGRARINRAERAAAVRRLDSPAGVEPSAAASFEPDASDLVVPSAGSNMWAVSPSRSESGHALLFINPHQPYFGPGQWYEGHLDSEQGLRFSGAGFFGSPIPTIGHNQFLGWSHTVNEPDVIDVYRETFDKPEDSTAYRYGDGHRQAKVWSEPVAVKTDAGVEVRDYQLRRTHHGAIVGERDGQALAVRMAMFEEGGQIATRLAMARARNLGEFQAAMATLATPMFNTLYADVEGHIWYLYNGAVPRRSTAYDWSQPVDGADPGTEWQGYHPLEELPQILDPPAGYLQNCNATPFLATAAPGNPDPTKYPPYMAPEADNPRSRISRRILESEDKFSFEKWQTYAFDTRVIEAEVWVPQLREAIDDLRAREPKRAGALAAPLALLEGWDHVATVDSTPMTLFFSWREIMIQQRNDDLIDSFERALVSLEASHGAWEVAWGEINRLQRSHSGGQEGFDDDQPSLAVAGGPGPLGIVFNFYTRTQGGSTRRYGVAGHSFVSVVEFAEPLQARSLLVFGESADKSSPHYFDQAELFAAQKFKPAWWTREEVLAGAERSYHPGSG